MSHCAGQRRAPAPARTYYYDATSGNNAYTGTAEHAPLQTMADLNARAFKPGDRILLKRGEAWTARMVVPTSGKPGRHIVYGAYGSGDAPQLNENSSVDCLNITSKNHITVQDLVAVSATGTWFAVLVETSADVTLRNVNASGSDSGCFFLTGAPATTHHIRLQSCVAHDGVGGGGMGGIQTSDAGNDLNELGPCDILIEDCTCYDNGSDESADHGIYLFGVERGLVRRCNLYGNAASGLKFNSCLNSIAEGNHIHDNLRFGIFVDEESGQTCNNNVFRNNIVRDTTHASNGYGIYINPNVTNQFFYHNTIINNCRGGGGTGYVIFFSSGGGQTGCVFKNNIIFQDGAVTGDWCDVYYVTATQIQQNTWDYNNAYYTDTAHFAEVGGAQKTFAQWQALTGTPDAHSQNSDPNFVADYTDLHLATPSDCIGNGDATVGVTVDYAGVQRGAAVDIGAYEYVA